MVVMVDDSFLFHGIIDKVFIIIIQLDEKVKKKLTRRRLLHFGSRSNKRRMVNGALPSKWLFTFT